jgi:cellulose synthase/poly-beta-1,6-N-acetylglucosamine synthase-like glycosyltransferase
MEDKTNQHPGRALLAFPSSGHDISSRFMRSVTELEAFDRQYALSHWERAGAPDSPNPFDLRLLDNYLCVESGVNIIKARNRAAAVFLDDYPHCDWLWFCDTDMVFEPELLHRLIARAIQAGARIMGALAVIQTADGLIPTLFQDDPETITQVLLDWPEGVVAEVAATGTGCLLIHRSVLEEMRDLSGGSNNCWFGEELRHGASGSEWWIGEDITFCLRAREAGFKVHVDCTTHVGHHKGPQVLWPVDIRNNRVEVPGADPGT